MNICPICKKNKNIKNITCSKSCGKKKENKEKYETFIKDGKCGNVIGEKNFMSAHIRKYLFEKYDKKCCECGGNKINTQTNKIPLQVDHIDGNSDNNNENNLRLLCPNCHSLTHTYMALNKGNGRKDRYKRE